jgi:peroxiredoxin
MELMAVTTPLSELPKDLPRPIDDGAASHLTGMSLPKLALQATSGAAVDIGGLEGRVVIYVYPMTGRPGAPLPEGWASIPGARGCTPQSCAFRDHYRELQSLDARLFGLSSQSTEYQKEARDRLQLPFELLSDEKRQLKERLRLPTFVAAGMELYKRLTMIAVDGRIEKVFYPVFPPDRNAGEVLAWLRG